MAVGIRPIPMGDLAAELRMSPMTLYKHFASKDELSPRWSTPGHSSSRRSTHSNGRRQRAAARRSRSCSRGPTPGRQPRARLASALCRPPTRPPGRLERFEAQSASASRSRRKVPGAVSCATMSTRRRDPDARQPRDAVGRSGLRGRRSEFAPRVGALGARDLGRWPLKQRVGFFCARRVSREGCAAFPVRSAPRPSAPLPRQQPQRLLPALLLSAEVVEHHEQRAEAARVVLQLLELLGHGRGEPTSQLRSTRYSTSRIESGSARIAL